MNIDDRLHNARIKAKDKDLDSKIEYEGVCIENPRYTLKSLRKFVESNKDKYSWRKGIAYDAYMTLIEKIINNCKYK